MIFPSSAQYLFRLDDICPTMRWSRFNELVALFNDQAIYPILAVVPDNQDQKLIVDPPAVNFWSTIKALADRKWTIAQHGYQHIYTTKESGLLGLRNRSEFAGLSFAMQYEKIQAGQKKLTKELGFAPHWWSAPSHSFDQVTCQVLSDLNFTHISDGIALYPFRKDHLTWVPHQTWSPRSKPFGVWTIGLHLNTMTNQQVSELKIFLRHHAAACQNIDVRPRPSTLNPIFRPLWYTQFKIVKTLS